MRRRIVIGTLSVAIITVLVGLVVAGVYRRALSDRAQAELFRQAEVTAKLVENQLETLGDAVVRQRAQAVARTLEQARLLGGHRFVEAATVTARGLKPLADNPRLILALPDDLTDREVVTVEVDGERIIATVRTVELAARTDILIAIGRSENLLTLRAATGPLVAALLVGGGLVLGLSILLTRSLSSRLRGLEQTAKAIAAGDLTARAPVAGDDEISVVAATFNEMGDRLQDAQRRERDFLMNVGHDLRTPLTTIRGYAEGLDAGHISEEDLPRVAGVLHAQTDRLSRLIEDLMLLARLEAREFTLRYEPVDLTAHVREIVTGYEATAAAARVLLSTSLSDVGLVEADADRVAQIVGNLIENALRYTPEAGTVAVSLDAVASGVRLEVADSGPGIDHEDVPHLFERLYVAQRYRPVRPEGSGLGLSIVKELADAMQGDIEVRSTPGRGTRVAVLLPRLEPPLA